MTEMRMPIPAPSYLGSARVGRPVAAARYRAGRAWARSAGVLPAAAGPLVAPVAVAGYCRPFLGFPVVCL